MLAISEHESDTNSVVKRINSCVSEQSYESQRLVSVPTPENQQHFGSSFTGKLFSILNTHSFNAIISWSYDGYSFEVKDPKKLEQEVLPKYFKHGRFQSLVRQLNFYSFKKVHKERTSWVYSHPCFQRNRPELLTHLHRKTHSLGSMDISPVSAPLPLPIPLPPVVLLNPNRPCNNQFYATHPAIQSQINVTNDQSQRSALKRTFQNYETDNLDCSSSESVASHRSYLTDSSTFSDSSEIGNAEKVENFSRDSHDPYFSNSPSPTSISSFDAIKSNKSTKQSERTINLDNRESAMSDTFNLGRLCELNMAPLFSGHIYTVHPDSYAAVFLPMLLKSEAAGTTAAFCLKQDPSSGDMVNRILDLVNTRRDIAAAVDTYMAAIAPCRLSIVKLLHGDQKIGGHSKTGLNVEVNYSRKLAIARSFVAFSLYLLRETGAALENVAASIPTFQPIIGALQNNINTMFENKESSVQPVSDQLESKDCGQKVKDVALNLLEQIQKSLDAKALVWWIQSKEWM